MGNKKFNASKSANTPTNSQKMHLNLRNAPVTHY